MSSAASNIGHCDKLIGSIFKHEILASCPHLAASMPAAGCVMQLAATFLNPDALQTLASGHAGSISAIHLLRVCWLQVTFVPATKRLHTCREAGRQQGQDKLSGRASFECLARTSFEPPVVQTYPYEQLSHAALSWVIAHQVSGVLVAPLLETSCRMSLIPHGHMQPEKGVRRLWVLALMMCKLTCQST